MTERQPLDLFRRALAGATRAIAKDAEADVMFASEASSSSSGKPRACRPPVPA